MRMQVNVKVTRVVKASVRFEVRRMEIEVRVKEKLYVSMILTLRHRQR